MITRIARVLQLRRLREQRAGIHYEARKRDVAACERAVAAVAEQRELTLKRRQEIEDQFQSTVLIYPSKGVFLEHSNAWRLYLRDSVLYWETRQIDADIKLKEAQEALFAARSTYRTALMARERIELLYKRMRSELNVHAEIIAELEAEELASRGQKVAA